MAVVILAGCAAYASAPALSPASPQVRASRLFAGPGQYPPDDFAAYGILAFQSEATPQSARRYMAICEGFLAGLPAAAELTDRGVPLAQQMATVWPLDDATLANYLNGIDTGSAPLEPCRDIVASIHLFTSREAIANAMRASDNESFEGSGPYLIAWSPSTTFGRRDVPVLVWDLSDVTTSQLATDLFVDWANEIVRNPDLWRDGWDLERLRRTLRWWADKYGPGILRVFGLGDV